MKFSLFLRFQIFLKFLRSQRFCLDPQLSPSYFNVAEVLKKRGWKRTKAAWRASFSAKHFSFHEKAAQQLEYKHHFAKLAFESCLEHCPLTYCINDENWPWVLGQIQDFLLAEKKTRKPSPAWILKPALLNNGQGICIFDNLAALEAHFLSSNRLGGEQVLQSYLLHPHLLRGHKYSLRLFAVLSNYAGNHLYPKGYFNVALQPFSSGNYSDLSGHLTNEHLALDAVNVIQIPSERFEFFPQLYQQIKTILTALVQNLKECYPCAFLAKKERNLALFGFDFLVDAQLKVWLLEANHGPCFPVEATHPLQKYLYQDFWEAFVDSFVLPIAEHSSIELSNFQCFEPLSF